MSEPKRAVLTSINTQKTDVKKVREMYKTVRFTLKLPESNETACPEFNYEDLLNTVEKRNKARNNEKDANEKVPPHVTNGLNILDPLEDNDDDVKKIAQKFEAKYGMQKPGIRKGKKDDYADIGAGYDESDSFIDNTDAYDEMVPKHVTTLHGDFYVNSGALEFKEDSSEEPSSSEEEDEPKKPVSKKRVIEDSDESDSEDGARDEETSKEPKLANPEKKQEIETNGFAKLAMKRSSTDERNPVTKKKKHEDPTKKKLVTVKDFLREKREELNMSQEARELGILEDVPHEKEHPKSVEHPKPMEHLLSLEHPKNSDHPKPLASSDAINDIIELLINAGRSENIDVTSKDTTSSDDVPAVTYSSESDSSRDAMGIKSSLISSSQESENHVELAKFQGPITKLPENLPANLYKLIAEIKMAAKHFEGQVKFFSSAVNTMFLHLEIQTKQLNNKMQRILVYEHLAHFVKCKKNTLMRRAKNMLLEYERRKMKEPLKKLKLLVEHQLPKAVKYYEKEQQKYKDEIARATNTSNGDISQIKKPRRRFPMTDEAEHLLYEIIMVKKKCFMLKNIRKESFEEHLEIFMKISVVCLWPDDWMPITTLMRHVKHIMEAKSAAKRATLLQLLAAAPKPAHSQQPQSIPMASLPMDMPVNLSPTKVASYGPMSTVSGVTVIPIPPKRAAPACLNSMPKSKHSSAAKSDISVSKIDLPSDLSTSLKNNLNSVTITSVDLRSNKPSESTNELKINQIPPSDIPKLVKPVENAPCQIIDLTHSPCSPRKPTQSMPMDLSEPQGSGVVRKHPKMKAKENLVHKLPKETSVIQMKSDENAHSTNNIMVNRYPNSSESHQQSFISKRKSCTCYIQRGRWRLHGAGNERPEGAITNAGARREH